MLFIIKMGGPISKYLDITNVKSFTKVVPGVVSRVHMGEGPSNMAFTSEELSIVPKEVKHTGKVTAV